jgi:glycosyltransferase involved in cell wall biosynthesis
MEKKLLITFPCYNEEVVLRKTFDTVYNYARRHLGNFDCQFLILDNASRDKTWLIAQKIRQEKGEAVLLVQELEKGRGVAMRKTWLKFLDYDIYTYMDADLATDLKDFELLVRKIDEGFDLATGSRYLPESDIVRGPKREFLSRIYNLLLKVILRVNFKDAQCGFKAFSQRLVREVIPQTKDSGWFWDTELMILATRQGYRVLEIPVSWREIRDEFRHSTVSHWSEICRQLKNIYKMWRRLKKEKN